ncbi:Adhesin YadA precursor [compost metagenome]
MALGIFATSGTNATALGSNSSASGRRSTAIGRDANATAEGSTAIGYQAIADRDYAVSVGRAGAERNIVHLADAMADTDAVNLRQARALDTTLGQEIAGWLGGGAGYAGGVFTAPNFTIQGTGYTNTGSALAAVDASLTSLSARIAAIPAGPQGSEGPQGPTGPQGPSGGVDPTYADAGDAATLTASQTHADAGDARTLTAALAYTDQRFAAVDDRMNALTADTDRRFSQQGQRIDRLGAMSSAQLSMAMNAGGGQRGRGRLAVGMGFQNGEEALSVGYGRRLATGVSFSIGGAFGRGGEKSGGVGFGIDLF